MSKTIEQRVDILLIEGVDNPKKWATVHGYKEPEAWMDRLKWEEWHDEWQRLRAHHLQETAFLFDVIRELVKRCNDHTSKIDSLKSALRDLSSLCP